MPKKAVPERYVVDRIGTQDPENSQYYVMDVVNDHLCREYVSRLGNAYRQNGMDVRSKECFALLDETLDAHRVVMEARNQSYKTKKKR